MSFSPVLLMTKSIHRLVALLLVSCLVGDPATVSAFQFRPFAPLSGRVEAWACMGGDNFLHEALAQRLVSAFTTVPLLTTEIWSSAADLIRQRTSRTVSLAIRRRSDAMSIARDDQPVFRQNPLAFPSRHENRWH